MARIGRIVVLLALALLSASASATTTLGEAFAQCHAANAAMVAITGHACRECGRVGTSEGWVYGWTAEFGGGGDHTGPVPQACSGGSSNTGNWRFDTPENCAAGSDGFDGSMSGTADANGDFCLAENDCKYELSGNGVSGVAMGGKTYGHFQQTGAGCASDPTPDTGTEGDYCEDAGDATVCYDPNSDTVCATTEKGSSFCWQSTAPNVQVDQTSDGGSESGAMGPDGTPPPSPPAPPEDQEPYEPLATQSIVFDNSPATIVVQQSDPKPPDADGDGKPDDEEEPICPPTDPECEDPEEEEDEAETIGPSTCAAQAFTCSGDVIDCGVYIEAAKIRCEAAHFNELLASLEKKIPEEIEETNAKLKALRDTNELRMRAIEKATDAVKDSTDSIDEHVQDTTTAVDGVRDAVADLSTSTDGVRTAVAGVRTAVDGVRDATEDNGTKLDGVRDAITEMDAHDNDQPDWMNANGMDTTGGEGATTEDQNALAIREATTGQGDIDESGFLSGGSCPDFPPLTVAGMSWEIDSLLWCDFLTMVRAVFMLVGAWWSVSILMER